MLSWYYMFRCNARALLYYIIMFSLGNVWFDEEAKSYKDPSTIELVTT
jgi:hypothetical protein